MNKIESLTGFLPRELAMLAKTLKRDGNFLRFENSRILEYRKRLGRLFATQDSSQKAQFYEFLVHVLSPRLNHPNPAVAGNLYDQGLFFLDPNGNFRCISAPARVALTAYLAEALKFKLAPINSVYVNTNSI